MLSPRTLRQGQPGLWLCLKQALGTPPPPAGGPGSCPMAQKEVGCTGRSWPNSSCHTVVSIFLLWPAQVSRLKGLGLQGHFPTCQSPQRGGCCQVGVAGTHPHQVSYGLLLVKVLSEPIRVPPAGPTSQTRGKKHAEDLAQVQLFPWECACRGGRCQETGHSTSPGWQAGLGVRRSQVSGLSLQAC